MRPDWRDVLAEYNEEDESGIDEAEITIMDLVRQRDDLSVAGATAKWLLPRRRKELYGDESTVNHSVSGKLAHWQVQIPAECLNLPPQKIREIIRWVERASREGIDAVPVPLLEGSPSGNGINGNGKGEGETYRNQSDPLPSDS